MDGASAGVRGTTSCSLPWEVTPWGAVVAAAASAAALLMAAALSAAGVSGGSLRMDSSCEAQPHNTEETKQMKVTALTARTPSSVRKAFRACPQFDGAHRDCPNARRDRKPQFCRRA